MRAVFSRKGSPDVFLYAFDVLELDGRDVRAQSWEARRALLTQLLNRCQEGLRLSEHIADTDGGSSSDKYMSWGLRRSSPSDAITRRGSRSRRQNLRLDKSGPNQVARTNCRGLRERARRGSYVIWTEQDRKAFAQGLGLRVVKPWGVEVAGGPTRDKAVYSLRPVQISTSRKFDSVVGACTGRSAGSADDVYAADRSKV
jgi:hypothetical protein